jgi:dihydroorotate dehydrogenase
LRGRAGGGKMRHPMLPLAEATYAWFLRPLMFRLDPERAHRMTLAILAGIPAIAPAPDPPELRTTLWGVTFSNPVGLAAGLDKDARAAAAWNALGFGFVELGTVTPCAQFGNPRPRMWRITERRALVNRLGFPSGGMEAVKPRIQRIRAQGLRMRIALNFGPNKETPPERVAEDYAALASRLGPLADFIVVNLSSPNTPGLRAWQAPERMRTIVEAVRASQAQNRRPLMVKLSPDLDERELREICAAAIDLALDGIVATNTTLKREEVGASFEGGLSGEPLAKRAREVIAQIYRNTQGRLPIIGVGGIMSAEDGYAHIRAGASMIEFYTGFVYRGPGLVREIKEGLVRLLSRDGFRSISEAVGSAKEKAA